MVAEVSNNFFVQDHDSSTKTKKTVDREVISAMLDIFGKQYQAKLTQPPTTNPIFTPTTSDMDRFQAKLSDVKVPPEVVAGALDKLKTMFKKPDPKSADAKIPSTDVEISPEQMSETDVKAAELLADLDKEFGPLPTPEPNQKVSGTPEEISKGNKEVLTLKSGIMQKLKDIQAKINDPNTSHEEKMKLQQEAMNLMDQLQNLDKVQGPEININNLSAEDIKKAMNFLQKHANGFDFDCADFKALPPNIQQYIKAGYQNAISKKTDTTVSATDTNTGF